jgi:protein-tyrosine phosphatase
MRTGYTKPVQDAIECVITPAAMTLCLESLKNLAPSCLYIKFTTMALKILMVCLGNICRSPMAHGLLQHKAEQLKLDWEIDSAGFSGYHEGDLPDPRSIACMKRHGIDITYQRSRPILYEDLFYYDHIFVMDKSNLRDVQQLARTSTEQRPRFQARKDKANIALVMSLVDEQQPEEVPDPYFGHSDAGFELVYEMLDRATNQLIEKYQEQ